MNPFEKIRAGIANVIHPQRASMEDLLGEMRESFQVFTGYTPCFGSYDEGIYEMAITRAAIDAIARHFSKLKPEVIGPENPANPKLKRMLQFKPNELQTTSQFLYKLATVLMVNNNAIIYPILTNDAQVVGYKVLDHHNFEVVYWKNKLFFKYTEDNTIKYIEFEKVGVVNRHMNLGSVFGDDNRALHSTMQLIHMQNQAIIEGIKAGGSVRFAAKLTETLKDKTVSEARQRFIEENLSMNNGGLILYDQKFQDFKQLDSKPIWIDDKQSKLIKENVYDYFGVSENILQNKYSEDEYNAFYEGLIEPLAIQLGQVMTVMTFTDKAIAYGNEIMFSANRLQYASNSTKLQISSAMLDRGVLNRNEVREIWQLPGIGPEGDKYVIRAEYTTIDEREVVDNAVQTE